MVDSSSPRDTDFSLLGQAKDWDELGAITQEMLGSARVDHFILHMKFTDSSGQRCHQVVSSLPPALAGEFPGVAVASGDVIGRHVAHQSTLLAWTFDSLCAQGSANGAHSSLRSAGLAAGWSIGHRNDQGISRIDFYASRCAGGAEQGLHNYLTSLALYLNDAARMLWLELTPRTKRPVLTSREQQCLKWSASGKTGNEIGSILGISQNTVYFHLKKAAAKFEVYGTRHTISKAIAMGLI